MWDGGGSADENLAVFQAWLRAGMPSDDPADVRMYRVLGLAGGWIAILVLVAGMAAWWWNPIAAAIVSAALAAAAVGVGVGVGRTRARIDS